MIEDPFRKKEQLAVNLRLATKEDLQTLIRLRLESLKGPKGRMLGVGADPSKSAEEQIAEATSQSPESWREYFLDDDRFTSLACLPSGEPIGFGISVEKDKKAGLWRIRNLYVKGEYEGRGVGRKLHAMRLKSIMDNGGKKVLGNVHYENDSNLHLMRSFGFKVFDRPKESLEDDPFLDVELDLTDPEVIKKINEALNAG